MKFKLGDRVIIVSFKDGFHYGRGFRESIRLNCDIGKVVNFYSQDQVNVQFDRDFPGLWGDRIQTLPNETVELEGQLITGRVMVIGEL